MVLYLQMSARRKPMKGTAEWCVRHPFCTRFVRGSPGRRRWQQIPSCAKATSTGKVAGTLLNAVQRAVNGCVWIARSSCPFIYSVPADSACAPDIADSQESGCSGDGDPGNLLALRRDTGPITPTDATTNFMTAAIPEVHCTKPPELDTRIFDICFRNGALFSARPVPRMFFGRCWKEIRLTYSRVGRLPGRQGPRGVWRVERCSRFRPRRLAFVFARYVSRPGVVAGASRFTDGRCHRRNTIVPCRPVLAQRVAR